MLARKKLSQKKVIILGGTIMVVWFIIGVLVYYNFSGRKAVRPLVNNTPGLPITTGPPTGKLPPSGGAGQELKVDLFDSQTFQQLKIYGEVPLKVKTLGRPNPFEPPANLNSTSNK